MPDYDLTGLSPRSFEQLIQAIALKVISPQTIIFGDGTDGGREASYYGKAYYPNEANTWDGYIVFQAKFCQRPTQDKKKDGDWAISQLKKELENFADSQKGRNKPEYYIFATNVILTSMLEKGSKDKVYKLFKDYQNTVPLKDYDIWDYDKIARFLDDNPGIRQSYAAWITSGDVLAEVIKEIKFNRPDFETVISNFLQKELLSDLYANLEQTGYSKDDKITLASVFVDLPFASRRILEASQNEEESFIVAQLIDNAKQKLDPQFLRDNFPIKRGARWIEELQKKINSGKWVVIGGPGQGKTTVGQFLCQLFRVAILKDKTNINDIEVHRAMWNFEAQCQKETIALPTVRRFPIRIILNDFAAKLTSEKEPIDSILDYITYLIHKRTSREISVDDLRQWLANYPWLIILDGLDEVPASSNRDEVLTAIRDFRIDANDVNADIMVVANTRPQGYNEDFGTDLYNHVWLTPLSNKQALHYASRLVELRYGNDSSRRETITFRLERAAQDDSTTRLMQSPLQVTIMTILCDRLGQPPKKRWKLFEAYYQVIYQREIERDIPASTLLREYQADINSIHYQMGLLLQVESERSGKTDARLSVKNFTTLVRNRLEEEEHEGQECEDLTKQIIEAAANRLVFLVGLEQDIVGFEIRSLQEFMASEAIMDGSDEKIKERLEEIISIISWRNVVLFAIGKCFTERQYLRDSIYTSCAALNDLDILYNATLAGSRLALDILEDGAIAQQPKYLKLFTRLALNLLDLPPDNFHIQLADVYTDSLKSIYQEEIAKRISNQNYYKSLGAWTCLLQLINLDFDWAIKLANKYWLQREEEKLEIIAAFIEQSNSLKLTKENWITKTTIKILCELEPFVIEKLIDWEKIKLCLEEKYQWMNLYVFLTNPFGFFPKIEKQTFVYLNCKPSFPIFTFTIISLLQSRDYCLNNLEIAHHLSNNWNIYTSIANFVKKPSKLSLFQSLKSIAENNNQQLIQNIDNLSIPWQISECLKFIQNNEELLTIAEKAKQGELGDFNDWRKAEQRWTNQGISEDDLTFLYNNDLPYTKNISKVGYPFLTTKLLISGSNFESLSNEEINYYLPTLKRLLKIKNNSCDKKVKFTINQCILTIINFYPNIIKNINILELFKAVEELLIEAKEISIFNIFFISSFIYIASITNDVKHQLIIFDFVNRYGEMAKEKELERGIFFAPKPNLNLINEIIDLFNNNNQLLGFLRIISFLDTSNKQTGEAIAKVKLNLLEPEQYSDSQYKAAAIIVSLYRKIWSEENINVIVDYAIQMIEEHSRIVTRILNLIEKKYFDQDVCERFLQQLKKKIPKSEWQQLNKINKLMNELLAVKTSTLVNKNNWNKLGLPQGASLLLPE